jgi:MOSC domain-containing protein YiiM
MPSPYVVQVNISMGGVPKFSVSEARVTFDGLIGDDWSNKKHHGIPGQAACLFSVELIEELRAEGYQLFPGALGENFSTCGLDHHRMRIGDVRTIGGQVETRITKTRTPCRTYAVYGEGIIRATYDAAVKRGDVSRARWGRSGFYAEVLHEGIVRPGDAIIRRPGTTRDHRLHTFTSNNPADSA